MTYDYMRFWVRSVNFQYEAECTGLVITIRCEDANLSHTQPELLSSLAVAHER